MKNKNKSINLNHPRVSLSGVSTLIITTTKQLRFPIKTFGNGSRDNNAPRKLTAAAFTLIELLVVVLIIGILVAVAMP